MLLFGRFLLHSAIIISQVDCGYKNFLEFNQYLAKIICQRKETELVSPSVSNEGAVVFKCTVCGHSATESVEKLQKWTSWSDVSRKKSRSEHRSERENLRKADISGDSPLF